MIVEGDKPSNSGKAELWVDLFQLLASYSVNNSLALRRFRGTRRTIASSILSQGWKHASLQTS